jgi:hypothetical protein
MILEEAGYEGIWVGEARRQEAQREAEEAGDP